MNGAEEALRSAHRLAYGLGLALCVGMPAVIAVLLLSGAVPPGRMPLDEGVRQMGYLFTGVVFLSAAWVWWRLGRALRNFTTVPEAQRPAAVFRESLLSAAVFEASSLLGLVYWLMAGAHAARHAWGFILLTPLLFAGFVPRLGRWRNALEG